LLHLDSPLHTNHAKQEFRLEKSKTLEHTFIVSKQKEADTKNPSLKTRIFLTFQLSNTVKINPQHLAPLAFS